jgi:arsenite-transporting ATPase
VTGGVGVATLRQRFRFFSGKGGTGKTTCAAAAALAAADAGGSVLLLSTDPAHSLGDALGAALGPQPLRVLGPAGELWAAEIAAEAALGRWLAARRPALELVAERGSYLDAGDVRTLFDLTPPGADELGGLLELVRVAEASGCAEVVVDTAPTAHTLRLLEVPAMLARLAVAFEELQDKHRVVAESLGGWYRPDAGDHAVDELAAEAKRLGELLRDGRRASFVWLLLPEALAVAESEDALAALERAGVTVGEVVINRVMGEPERARGELGGRTSRRSAAGREVCARCRRRREAENEAIAEARRSFGGRGMRLLPEEEEEPRGLAALRRVGAALSDPKRGVALAARGRPGRGARAVERRGGGVPEWVEELGGRRLLLFGGKGGVGKTTCAAAAALAIAARWPGEPLLLVSTDPAHSLGDVLAAPLGDEERPVPGAPPNLRARELDAPAALARWRGGHHAALDGVLAGLTGELPGPGSGGAAGRGAQADGMAGGPVAGDLLDLVPTGLDELVGVLALVDALLGEEGEDGKEGEEGEDGEDAEEGESSENTENGESSKKAAGRQRRLETGSDAPRGPLPGRAPRAAHPVRGAAGSAGRYARVVVDTAPTGHALRLMAMPELALAWDHALLSLLLKYREVAPAGELAAELVSLSRRLKRFAALLRDPAACRFVAVARAAELPCRETARLMAALEEMGIRLGGLVVNAVTPIPWRQDGGGAPVADCARCARRAEAEAPHLAALGALARGRGGPPGRGQGEGCAMILAPAEFPPPRGARRLGEWGQSWEVDRS